MIDPNSILQLLSQLNSVGGWSGVVSIIAYTIMSILKSKGISLKVQNYDPAIKQMIVYTLTAIFAIMSNIVGGQKWYQAILIWFGSSTAAIGIHETISKQYTDPPTVTGV